MYLKVGDDMGKLRTRLHVLMGEKKIKSINKLHQLTGLSRKTLSRIYNEEAEQLDYKTVETLCQFFDVQPGELFYIEESDQE